MQRFKKYIGKDFIIKNINDSKHLNATGFNCNYLPDSLGDFDELEFSSDFSGQTILMCVAVLEGKIKRIMFVQIDKESPDDVRPLTESQLTDFLDQRGVQLTDFFEHITQ
jgi:hypothetical protein